jgi:hypothetical protein
VGPPKPGIPAVVAEVVQALQLAQGQTLPAPPSMKLALVATPELLGQGHLPRRPLGDAGNAVVQAWIAAPAGERRCTILRGDGQFVTKGASVPVKPAVQVTDGFGRPAAGVTVTFKVLTGGGSVTGAPATTGDDGTAAVSDWTVGNGAGLNALEAHVSGGPKVTFRAVAL